MSIYAVNKICYRVVHEPELRRALREAPAEALRAARPPLSSEELEAMLAGLRDILASWHTTKGRSAAVCPHIETKGGDTRWNNSRSARNARNARKSLLTAIPSASARTRTRPS